MGKILSIVIPTYNRVKLLKLTLDKLIPQINRYSEEVELIIGDNYSNDETKVFTKNIQKEYDFIRSYSFENHTPPIDNYLRSVSYAKGKYVIIWGDDDIPLPYSINHIVDILKENPDLGLLHYNYLIGKDKMEIMTKLKVLNPVYNGYLEKMDISKMIYSHAYDCGFTTSVVFLKEGWDRNLSIYDSTHYGYEFLSIMFHGAIGYKCGYISTPLIIQRQPFVRSWHSKWPLYALVGIPNIMRCFDNDRLTNNAVKVWREKHCNFSYFIRVLLTASSYKKENKHICKDINKNQKGLLRHFLTYAFIYFCPGFVNTWLRKMAFR